MNKVIKVKVIRQNKWSNDFMVGCDGENRNEKGTMYLANELMSECNKRNIDSMSGAIVLDVETDSTGDNLLIEADLLDVVNNLDDDDIVLFLTTDKKVMMPKWEKLSESIEKGVGLVKTTGCSGGDYITSVNYKTKEVA